MIVDVLLVPLDAGDAGVQTLDEGKAMVDVGPLTNEGESIDSILSAISQSKQVLAGADDVLKQKQDEVNIYRRKYDEARTRLQGDYDALYDWLMRLDFNLAPVNGTKLGLMLRAEYQRKQKSAEVED